MDPTDETPQESQARVKAFYRLNPNAFANGLVWYFTGTGEFGNASWIWAQCSPDGRCRDMLDGEPDHAFGNNYAGLRGKHMTISQSKPQWKPRKPPKNSAEPI